MYICVFGGTFNPFHIGHYEILKALDSDPRVEKILLMPDRLPPHKTSEFLIDDESRIQMCKIASEDFTKCELCLIEFEREGKSYTVDTVKLLKERYPDKDFAFAIGGDMFVSFKQWRKYEELIKMLSFFVFKRSATDMEEFGNVFKELTKEGMRIILKDDIIPAVSSTELRNNFEKSKDLLPERIYNYLKERGVYL